MKKEKPSNRDIVREAYAVNILREQIPDVYKEFGITKKQVAVSIRKIRKRGEVTYEPLAPPPSQDAIQRLRDARRGIAPKEALRKKLTVWPLVLPLAERGFIPAEIVEVTGLTPQQVYNALHEKRRKIAPIARYNSPENVANRNKAYHQRAGERKRGISHVPEVYDRRIQLLARRILELRLIKDPSDLDSINELLALSGHELRTKSSGIVLEAVFLARKLASNGDEKMKRYYIRISRIAEEVLYREEDYQNLELIRGHNGNGRKV